MSPTVSRAELRRINRTQSIMRLLQGASEIIGRLLGRKSKLIAKHATGLCGEQEALFFLQRQGYVIIARRWRAHGMRGELDLVGWDGDTLCFIEVKTRTQRDWAPAESAIDPAQQRTLRRVARAFLRRRHLDDAHRRGDVVSVYLLDGKAECELLRNWFVVD